VASDGPPELHARARRKSANDVSDVKTRETATGAWGRAKVSLTWLSRCVAAASLLSTTGCGGFFYALYAGGATSKLETAQQLGAEKYAPYEYYFAKEHLLKAMEEASSADYGDAIDLASEAEKSAEKAIVLSKQAHEGAGR
jgi:hypothetical protein